MTVAYVVEWLYDLNNPLIVFVIPGILGAVAGLLVAARLLRRIRERVASQPAIAHAAIERLGEADLPTRLALLQFLGAVRAGGAAVAVLLAGRDEALEPIALAARDAGDERMERIRVPQLMSFGLDSAGRLLFVSASGRILRRCPRCCR